MRYKLKTSWLIIIAISILSFSAESADPKVTLTVDKPTATIDDFISLQVSVEGKSLVGRPELYGIEDFQVRSAGTSSQMQIINGRMSSSKVFQYVLTPRGTGRFTIGPAVVTIGGTEYRSQTVTLNIVGERTTAPRERNAYLTAQASNSEPSVGEQIVYTIRFYTRVSVQNAQLDIPEFTGFWSEQIGKARNTQQVINGQVWQVSEIKFALFPTEAGTFTIDRAGLTADVMVSTKRPSPLFSNPFFDSFYDMERKNFRSSPVEINVKPLPPEGRPVDFSGLVGTFSMSESISSTKLEAGESTTLTLKIQGDGDLRNYPPPKLEESGNFKVYDDEPTFNVEPRGKGLRETKIFKKAIVPLNPGRLNIPAFHLYYFDPQKEEYVTVSTEPIALNVSPSSRPEGMVISSGEGVVKHELEVLGEDLMPVIKRITALESDLVSGRCIFFYIVIAAIPLVGFIFALFWRRRLERLRTDVGYLRRGRAFKRAHKEVRKLAKTRGSEFYKNASLVLRDYIGDRCTIDGRSLTAADVARRLEPLGVSGDTCGQTVKFLNNCDAGLYGGKEFTEEDHRALTRKLNDLLKRLEKEIKR